MALAGGGGGGHARGRRRPRKQPLSEINVTPLVDVMLVLLIIFMVSAPLLNVAVPVELPKTDASAVDASDDPVVISIKRDGAIYVGEREVSFDRLVLTVAVHGGPGARDQALSVLGTSGGPGQPPVPPRGGGRERAVRRHPCWGFQAVDVCVIAAIALGPIDAADSAPTTALGT